MNKYRVLCKKERGIMFTKKQKTFCSRPLRENDLLEVSLNSSEDILSPDEHGKGILLSILERMKDLAPMGDDDSRSLWVETLSDDSDDVAWYEITSGSYRDSHYLIISDEDCFSLTIMTGGGMFDSDVDREVDLSDFLTSLSGYISRLVGRIVTSPEKYNRYIEANLPYSKRSGRILRSRRDALIPWMRIQAPEGAVDFVKECVDHEDSPSGVEKMGAKAFLFALKTALDEAGEYWGQFDSLGEYTVGDDDYENCEEIMDWKLSGDYRIRLKKNPEGKRYVSVRCLYEECLDLALEICLSLVRQGFPVMLENPSAILDVLEGKDYIDVYPGACDFDNEIGMSEMILPIQGRMDPEAYDELVEAIEWEPLAQVMANPFRR